MTQASSGPAGSPEGPTAATAFAVRETSDGLRVLLTCTDPGDEASEIVDRIMEEIPRLELAREPSRDEIEHRVLSGHRPGADIVDLILVEGMPPGESTDGWIEWARDFFAKGFAVDEKTEVIDYWQRLENRSVEEGDNIAVIHPAVRGHEGNSLHDVPVPSRVPNEARIRFGGNVKLEEEEDGTLVARAGIPGRVRWVENVLSVDDVYTIGGSVDMEHGNVDHAGALVVRGDVLHGAHVHAKGDIIIEGVIEPSIITTGGNLVVRGGIVGSEGSVVEVGGDLQARYLHDATVTVGGDVTISREILNSRLRARGELAISGGRIVGGHVDALRGMDIGIVGADGAKTRLTVGRDVGLLEEISRLRAEIEELEARREKIDSVLGVAGAGSQATEDNKKVVESLTREAKVTDTNLTTARAALENAVNLDRMYRDSLIHVRKSLQEDTTLEIHRDSLTVDETQTGARTIGLEGRRVSIGRFCLPKRTRLTKKKKS